MKRNRRGFTVTELVIVVAIVAILAGILIPTFDGITNKSNQNAALQNARTALTAVLTDQEDAALDDGTVFAVGEYAFVYTAGRLEEAADADTAAAAYTAVHGEVTAYLSAGDAEARCNAGDITYTPCP